MMMAGKTIGSRQIRMSNDFCDVLIFKLYRTHDFHGLKANVKK